MHILKYYIKRCIGLPGDTLSIQNGRFRINGMKDAIGHLNSQKEIGRTLSKEFPKGVYNAFSFDSTFNWNIRDFGPLYIPKAGDKGMNSQDSRYWGLLPEEYIVGKAAFVWKSVDPYTGEFRWKRFMKKIE